MNNIDLARHLYAIAKKNPCVNYQDNKLLHTASKRLLEADRTINALQAENEQMKAALAETQYLLAEREGIQEDAPLDASAPGEAAEDFFEDATDDYWDDFCS